MANFTENTSSSALVNALESMKGKLSVSRCKNWEEQWGQAIGMSPSQFYETLTKDLPGDITIHIEFNGGGQGEFRIESTLDGNRYFSAERKFSRSHGTLSLEEFRIHNENERRQGLGKQMLRNHLDLASRWGSKTINIRGGREDGPFFWSRRAAFLEDVPILKERFITSVLNSADELDIDSDTRAKLNQIIESKSPSMNFNIARLEGDIDGRPTGAALLRNSNPRVIFDLENKQQMQAVYESLER